jgi:DNA repair protein RecO
VLIEAIVIKKMPLREHDQLVVLYTRELGKTLAAAKSIMKAHSVQALQLDEGNLVRCELVAGKGMPIITGAQALLCYRIAKASPLRWAAAQFFLQIIDAVVFDHQQDGALFEHLSGTLAELNQESGDVLDIFRRRQASLLEVLGYGRQLTEISSARAVRGPRDDEFEHIAQRRLATIDFFYELARA